MSHRDTVLRDELKKNPRLIQNRMDVAYQEGYAEGFKQAEKANSAHHKSLGYSLGYEEGYKEGYSDGLETTSRRFVDEYTT